LTQNKVIPFIGLAAWIVIASGCANTPGPGLARGKQIYDTCVPCHGAGGQGSPIIGAPQIAGLPQWYVAGELNKFKSGIRGAHQDDVEGARMRPMARSLYRKGDVESVAEYVATLKPEKPVATLTSGSVEAGKTRFTSLCITCHMADGSGSQAMLAPPLMHQADWYMYSQLQKFKKKMRGATSEDAGGTMMAGMAATLPDTMAMRDVIAYIRTIQK
jgi:cytochrome c oxidase subunit 2